MQRTFASTQNDVLLAWLLSPETHIGVVVKIAQDLEQFFVASRKTAPMIHEHSDRPQRLRRSVRVHQAYGLPSPRSNDVSIFLLGSGEFSTYSTPTDSACFDTIASHGSVHAEYRMTADSKSIAFDDSPFVATVSFMRVRQAGTMLVPPDGTWDLVFIRDAHGTRALRTGMTTKAFRLLHSGTEEILAISFKASAKIATVDPVVSLDKGYALQGDHRRFAIAGEIMEIPTFDNADAFVDTMQRRGLLQRNPLVQAILDGEPMVFSARTLQRQFKLTTGMTHKRFTMIERARLAAARLRKGETAQNVVHSLGYYDQAHLINSLREIVGQTPSELGLPETPGL